MTGQPGSAEDRLRKIDAVTDSALADMSTEELLHELLLRARDLLAVDSATVLLLDDSKRYLLVVAAVGIEDEVRQGVRVPVGEGFAGQVAARREPVVIDRVDSETVVNHLLWEHGLRVLMGVPLVAAGRLIGVLHVGSASARRFTDEDCQLLQLVADRIALAAHTRVSAVERAAAAALQRSLLPAVLPEVPGLSFAARYVPGTDSGVGGDWYDVFPLPGARVGIVMGDVVGTGLAAAVVMGRLRSALRAYALDVDDPGEVLDKLNRKANHFEVGVMATVSYAIVDPSRAAVRLALAGHPPPVLAEPDGAAELVKWRAGPPVGAPRMSEGYRTDALALWPGALLLFYTDGLVERRDSTIDVGLRRLCQSVRADRPDAVCARVMAALVGTRPADDDIAVLAMRRERDAG